MGKKDRVLGLINLMESDYQLKSLTSHRPLAAIPFGGRYRVVDFVLSNLTQAGIDTVGIYLKDKERSLMDHIRSGRPWDMDRMSGGIFYFSPFANPNLTFDLKGDVMNFYNNIDILDKSNCEYVVIAGSAMVMNIDLAQVIETHKAGSADVTVVYQAVDALDPHYDNAYVVNLEGEEIKSFGTRIMKRQKPEAGSKANISCEIYVLKTKLFREMIEDAVSSGSSIYMREVLHDSAKLYSYKGYAFEGYMAFISSVANYFQANLELLNEDHLLNLFYGSTQINTKIRNENPAYYGEDSLVENSLIANGCEILGEVKNSILFRRVKVEAGAKLENCIIMQNGVIKSGSTLKNLIADKNVTVGQDQTLMGTTKNPLVLAKDSSI